MKHVLLKAVKVEGGEVFSYKEQLIAIVRNGGAGGIAAGEMDDHLRVLRALRGCEDGQVMELEDADFKNMCRYVKESKWLAASEEAFDFINDVQRGDDSLPELGSGNGSGSGSVNGQVAKKLVGVETLDVERP